MNTPGECRWCGRSLPPQSKGQPRLYCNEAHRASLRRLANAMSDASMVTIRYVLEELTTDYPELDVEALYDRFVDDRVLTYGIERQWRRSRDATRESARESMRRLRASRKAAR